MYRVLYVDDEPALLDITKVFLEQSGDFSLDTALSAQDGLDSLQKKEYDAVVSDYQMPGMNGIEFLKAVRAGPGDLPFILFTGRGREEIAIEAINNGVDSYLQKGGDTAAQFADLGQKIRAAIERCRAIKALRESEDRYRNVVEDQSEFICRFRPDGTHLFVNDAYCRYFGVKIEDIIGHRFIPVIPEEDGETNRSHFASLTRNNPVGMVEHRIILPGGRVLWQQWSDRAIFDASGTLVEYQSVGRDITERKTAELDLMKKNDDLAAAYEELTSTEEELRASYDDLAKSQRALEEREITLDAIIRESPVLQFVIDRNHRVLYWNRALAAYSGIAADTVVGTDQQWRAFYPARRPTLSDLLVDNAPDTIPEWFRGKYTKSALSDGAYEVTDFFPRIGRHGTWLHFTAGLIRNRDGVSIGAVESLEDVTEQKTAELELTQKNNELHTAYEQLTAIEEELRTSFDTLAKNQHDLEESGQRYRSVVEDQTEFICRFTPDGRLTFVNDAYCRYFGLDKHSCIGALHTVVIPKDDIPLMKQHLKTLTPENPVATIEHRIVLPSGDVRWQQWSDRAIFDASGTLFEYQSVGRDITGYKLAEQKIRESEVFNREVINGAKEGIVVYDRDLTITLWNRFMEELTGLPAPAVLGKNAIELFPFHKVTGVARLLEQAVSGETGSSLDFPFTIKETGRSGWVRGIYSPHYDANGRVVGVVGILQDITERRMTEDALREANRKLNLLAGITRHDILNQVLALKGYISLSHEHIGDATGADYAKKEKKILDTIERQLAFTRDYQDMGIKSAAWQNVNAGIVHAVGQLPMRDITVQVDRCDLEIMADPLFEKVFYNVIDNALRYGGDTLTAIRVSSQESERGLVIVCEDDGAGIPREDKKHLFTKGFGKNTGLGLFLSREILSITGITITENGVPEKGARFAITVPKGKYRFTDVHA